MDSPDGKCWICRRPANPGFLTCGMFDCIAVATKERDTLRAQLAEAREAARVLMHAALTRASVVSLEQIQAAIDTVEKWEGK